MLLPHFCAKVLLAFPPVSPSYEVLTSSAIMLEEVPFHPDIQYCCIPWALPAFHFLRKASSQKRECHGDTRLSASSYISQAPSQEARSPTAPPRAAVPTGMGLVTILPHITPSVPLSLQPGSFVQAFPLRLSQHDTQKPSSSKRTLNVRSSDGHKGMKQGLFCCCAVC